MKMPLFCYLRVCCHLVFCFTELYIEVWTENILCYCSFHWSQACCFMFLSSCLLHVIVEYKFLMISGYVGTSQCKCSTADVSTHQSRPLNSNLWRFKYCLRFIYLFFCVVCFSIFISLLFPFSFFRLTYFQL